MALLFVLKQKRQHQQQLTCNGDRADTKFDDSKGGMREMRMVHDVFVCGSKQDILFMNA